MSEQTAESGVTVQQAIEVACSDGRERRAVVRENPATGSEEFALEQRDAETGEWETVSGLWWYVDHYGDDTEVPA